VANELRSRTNMVAGGLTSSITSGATSMSSPGLADLGVIDATNYAAIMLFTADATGRILAKEIVWVTAHTAAATTATIVRGQEGTAAAAWAAGATWAHAATVKDLEGVAFGTLGYAQLTSAQTGITTVADVTSCSVTVYVAPSRRIRVSGQAPVTASVANDHSLGRIKEGGTSLGVWFYATTVVAARDSNGAGSVVLTPSAGSHTYKLTMERTGVSAGDISINATATNPAFILVEDIGAV
jgi:hypothetical protein